jgi:hypothetical protein
MTVDVVRLLVLALAIGLAHKVVLRLPAPSKVRARPLFVGLARNVVFILHEQNKVPALGLSPHLLNLESRIWGHIE